MDRQRRYTDKQSPVYIVTRIREELAEFQKISNKQALRETLRKELRAACKEALDRAGAVVGADADAADSPDSPSYPNIEPSVEYLQERGLIRPKLSRARVRQLKSALPPSEKERP
jgi:hypothetical protein